MPTIRELPEDIKEIAIERMLTQHPERTEDLEKWMDHSPSFAFNFSKTPEGGVWGAVAVSDYTEFYKLHHELGTPTINNTYPLY